MVQFQAEPERMPIENPMVPWKESDSPYHAVARLRIPRQGFLDSPAQTALCENISFNPWRTLSEHRPLGTINRVRLDVYQAISQFRHARNDVPSVDTPHPDELPPCEPPRDGPPALRRQPFYRRWFAGRLKRALLLLIVLSPLLVEAWRFYNPRLAAAIPHDYSKALHINKPDPSLWPEKWRYEANLDWWYHTSQGSLIMPYSWFVALEQFSLVPLMPRNFTKFTETEHLTRFRVIPNTRSEYNPDGLPVGFTKTNIPDPVTGEHFVGVTCAGCHTGQMTYEGKLIIIEGGAGQLDTIGTLERVNFSLLATVSPIRYWHWRRFAGRVLKENDNHQNRKALRKQVNSFLKRQISAQFLDPGLRNLLKSTPAGFGRIDALNTGGNALYTKLNPDNFEATDAPVSVPPLWYTSRYDWVQLNGSIRQPLSRNVIEGIAVNAFIDMFGEYGPKWGSTVEVENMWRLEDWHGYLEAPVWPDFFPRLDRRKVEEGKEIYYREKCAECHAKICTKWIGDPQKASPFKPAPDPVSERWNFGTYHLRSFNFYEIGTDPEDAMDFANRTLVDASKIGIGEVGETVAGALVIAPVIENTLKQRFAERGLTVDEQQQWSGYRDGLWDAPPSYPARPLAGVWSTAPYLHNGSVPSLYELLLPPDQRSKTFYLGDIEFDPLRVGFRNYKKMSRMANFRFETDKTGNRNKGHDYGTNLSDDERYALIEYLKALRFEDEDWEDYGVYSDYGAYTGQSGTDRQRAYVNPREIAKPWQPWQQYFAGLEWVQWVEPANRCEPWPPGPAYSEPASAAAPENETQTRGEAP